MYYRDSCSAAAQAIVTALRSARRVQPGADAISVLSTYAWLLAAAPCAGVTGIGLDDGYAPYGRWRMADSVYLEYIFLQVGVPSYVPSRACSGHNTELCRLPTATAVHDPAVGGRSVLIQCVLYVVMANAAPHRALRLYLSTWGSPCRVALALCAWP